MPRGQRPAPAAPGATREAPHSRAAEGPLPSAARALFWGSLALLALRALAALLPGRWLWGLDLARDLPRAVGIAGIAIPLALHLPRLSQPLARIVPRGPRAQRAFAGGLALALVVFLWSHPDRALYTGDASIRHGAFAAMAEPGKLAEQALRGDLFLHYDLPRWASEHTPWSAEQVGRAQGALLAVIAALCGWALASALGVRGELALAVAAIAAGTGALALDNGYGKSSVEVACLTGIAAVGVARAGRDGGGLGTVGASVALALLLHRSALALLPAWAACAAIAFRAGTLRRATALAGLVGPPLAIALVGPQLARVVGAYDLRHHVAAGGLGGTLSAAIAPAHLLDVIHTLNLVVPVALLVPLLLLLPPRPAGREAAAFAALALPPLALLLLVHPQQGLARDWDVFAFAGVALAAVAAWRVAAVLGAIPRARWLALPLAAVAAVPSLQFAALQSDPGRAWSRAEAILVGPPARDPSERARSLSTIGAMLYGRRQYADALVLFERSAEAAPNPRAWVEMGMAETMLGRPADALAHYRHAASLNPDLVTAWRGVAAAASALGDREAMQQAVQALERLEPNGITLHDARAWLEANAVPRRSAPR